MLCVLCEPCEPCELCVLCELCEPCELCLLVPAAILFWLNCKSVYSYWQHQRKLLNEEVVYHISIQSLTGIVSPTPHIITYTHSGAGGYRDVCGPDPGSAANHPSDPLSGLLQAPPGPDQCQ